MNRPALRRSLLKLCLTLALAFPMLLQTQLAAEPAPRITANPSVKSGRSATPAMLPPTPQFPFKTYKVKRKDTLYGIARAHQITVDELMEANPELKASDYKLKKGVTLRIPVKPAQPAYQPLDTLKVAVVLPFVGKGMENERSVEFYRGMLMGIDELKAAGLSVHVSAFNEPAPEQGIAPLMAGVLKVQPDVVVGPLYPSHFTEVASHSSREMKVVIPFSSKVPQVEYRPELFVINTPERFEAEQAAALFESKFKKDRCVVLLKGLNSNRQTFCQALLQRLLDAGYQVLQYPASTSAADLAAVLRTKNKKVMLVPADDSSETLDAMLAKSAELRALLPDTECSLLGYDKWISLSEGPRKKDMHAASTYIITPNFYFPYTKASMDFSKNYRQWFNTELLSSNPRMAPLGYDFSIGFLAGMATYGHDFNTQSPQPNTVAARPKLQNQMLFAPAGTGGGYVSRSMWLIHFKTDQSIVKLL
ncbi:MAG: LysM peptidoglycan-binding domain-containing protein [Alloprevotella sp.]